MKGIPGKGIPGNPRAYQFCVRKTGMKLELTTVCAFDFGNHAVQIQDTQFVTRTGMPSEDAAIFHSILLVFF